MKKLCSLAVMTALCLTLTTNALATSSAYPDNSGYFPAIQDYVGFDDVSTSDWYYTNVGICYEIGIMEGTDVGFNPYGTLSLAEIITLAARIHSILKGTDIDMTAGDGTWYGPYVAYLETQIGLGFNEGFSPASTANRYEFIYLLNVVMSEDLLTPINDITALPDTSEDFILTFYNAGILTGTDDYGTFSPDNSLTRAEAAAMISRIARDTLRISFTPAQRELLDTDDLSLALLGYSGDTVYFTDGGNVTITLEEALPSLVNVIDTLIYRCTYYGLTFSLDYNLVDGSTALSYYNDSAFTDLLLYGWAMSLDADVTISADSEAFVADTDKDTYTSLGYTTNCLTSHTYYGADLMPYLLAQYDDEDDFAAWQEENGYLAAKHILVDDLETAEYLYDLLVADITLFDELMLGYTTDPGITSYPDGYFFGPGEMVASFEESTAALEVGEMSEPIYSDYGYHIILRIPYDWESYQTELLTEDFTAYIAQLEESSCMGLVYEGIDYETLYANLMILRGN